MPSVVIDFPPFQLDLGGWQLRRDGEPVPLPPKTFAVLRHLAERPGELVTKRALLDAVWPGVAVTEDVVRLSIFELRAALGDERTAPRFVETVPRRGYRFVATRAPVGGTGDRVGALEGDDPPAGSRGRTRARTRRDRRPFHVATSGGDSWCSSRERPGSARRHWSTWPSANPADDRHHRSDRARPVHRAVRRRRALHARSRSPGGGLSRLGRTARRGGASPGTLPTGSCASWGCPRPASPPPRARTSTPCTAWRPASTRCPQSGSSCWSSRTSSGATTRRSIFSPSSRSVAGLRVC